MNGKTTQRNETKLELEVSITFHFSTILIFPKRKKNFPFKNIYGVIRFSYLKPIILRRTNCFGEVFVSLSVYFRGSLRDKFVRLADSVGEIRKINGFESNLNTSSWKEGSEELIL